MLNLTAFWATGFFWPAAMYLYPQPAVGLIWPQQYLRWWGEIKTAIPLIIQKHISGFRHAYSSRHYLIGSLAGDYHKCISAQRVYDGQLLRTSGPQATFSLFLSFDTKTHLASANQASTHTFSDMTRLLPTILLHSQWYSCLRSNRESGRDRLFSAELSATSCQEGWFVYELPLAVLDYDLVDLSVEHASEERSQTISPPTILAAGQERRDVLRDDPKSGIKNNRH